MNGLVVVNKEKGYTSFDIVAIAKKCFGTKRIGHLGTLDPLATGVLVLCIDEATKLVPFLENHDKEYLAEILIGKSTNTYDNEGEVIEEKEVLETTINEKLIDDTLKSFLGASKQIPPMFSAIKVNGQKLYNLARQNIEIDIPPRDIFISNIERTSPLDFNNHQLKFSFKCTVSKGTYIRSLCKDIGLKINYPALMNNLTRLRSGCFDLTKACTIDDLKNKNFANMQVISLLDALKDYPIYESGKYETFISNGVKLYPHQVNNLTNSNLIIFKHHNELHAIYEYDQESKLYKALRVWK